MVGQTLYDKVFADHVVTKADDKNFLIFIDRHLVHEVTSPQAFEGLKNANRKLRRLDCTLATVDHNIPTSSRKQLKKTQDFIQETDSRTQVVTLEENVKDFGVQFFGMKDRRQGIVHVVGPEQGFTLPGTTVVCGDSHTSTHGAFGALAFGIGTSEVEHVLATQTLLQAKSKNMLIDVRGSLKPGITSKDLMLHIISVIGTAGGTGCVMEFRGPAISELSVEARMSMCNMSIEAGARAGMIAPDDKTVEYFKERSLSPPQGPEWEKAVKYWQTLKSDEDAQFDIVVPIEAQDVQPTITWGTSPQDALPILSSVPDPSKVSDDIKRAGMQRSLDYMGLEPNTPLTKIYLDKIFIGSCTNSRLEDLRAAAKIVRGKKIASNIKRAMIVPGSGLVKQQAEAEGIDKVFTEAGFEWREAGCSMCLGMNADILSPHERCASTSNRNFEGRQGALGRTHLMSPPMAAAAAIEGHIVDIRDYFTPEDSEEPTVSVSSSKRSKVESTTGSTTASDSNATDPMDANPIEEQAMKAEESAPKETTEQAHVASGGSGIPKFRVERGIGAPLAKANVDTDAIIPKQFLKTIKRTGLKVGLFYELRNAPDAEGNMKPTDFVLNVEPYTNAKFLVVSGDNFGCGSSREHAPWALADFGFRAIIAPSFGDIFYSNSLKNGLLPIRLPADVIASKLIPLAEKAEEFDIDLENQQIKSGNGEVLVDHFEIDPFRKNCLLNGLDDIGITLQKDAEIKKFEALRSQKFSFFEAGTKKLGSMPDEPAYIDLNEASKDW